MKILIAGYGKMGKAVEKQAENQGFEIVFKIDHIDDWKTFDLQNICTDVVIEFSRPDAVVNNIKQAFHRKLPIVTGTTGWDTQQDAVFAQCRAQGQALFYAPNYSMGMYLFIKLNQKLSSWMAKQRQYQVRIEETHHKAKLDAPSGTAIKLAGDIVQLHPDYDGWRLTSEPLAGEIPISSNRWEGVTGIHEVIFHSEEDEILIRHKAESRDAFAQGALMAASFIRGRKGVFSLEDLANEMGLAAG